MTKKLKKIKSNFKKYWLRITAAVAIFLFYWQSLFTYFQGDEWYYFKLILPFTKEPNGALTYIYETIASAHDVSSGAHLTPIANFLYFLSVKFFAFNYWPYALSGIIIHIINSFLVFRFVQLLLPKNRIIWIIASFFFAFSYIHQQAVTWTMTYMWTALSVTFFLFGLIYFLKKRFVLSALFAFCALLTKETTIILFPVIALLWFLHRDKNSLKKIWLPYGLVLLIFLPYRFLIPKFFAKLDTMIGHVNNNPTTVLETPLLIFRAIVYPLKGLTEVFVPAEWIRSGAEFLTPLAYPAYSVDMKILGSVFVTFTQTAGSDIIIFMLAVLFLLLIIFAIKTYHDHKQIDFRNALIVGIALIVLSVMPLLSVSTYAPWWAYVTFIDSRHLYIASIGGAILFAFALVAVASFLASILMKFRLHISPNIFIFGILTFWLVVQYFLLRNEMNYHLQNAQQRTSILNKILDTVPENKSNKVIFVESDQGYYGFDIMPPFQINLGQILAVIYYQREQLPVFFINSDFITKGGLRGEGYIEEQGKGFGYYLNRETITQEIKTGHINVEDVYAFSWKSKKNTITDITDEFREKMQKQKIDFQPSL